MLQSVGEGTYGLVLRCVHKSTGAHVAIKKFKEARDEERVSPSHFFLSQTADFIQLCFARCLPGLRS